MSTYRLELLNIHKSFGGVTALQDVTLRARPGEIHAIVGENGAGKSTLMKILAGAYRMDKGQVLIDAEKVNITDPGAGRKAGVGIIYQELSLVPDLSVAENIYLHYLNQRKFWLKWSEINKKTRTLIGDLGFEIPPSAQIRSLSISRQQVVEIAKALSENVDILILDEPTSVLAPHETLRLFEVLRKLKEKGVTILYISHRLEEVFAIADTISILKDGRLTRTVRAADTDQDEVIRYMIGRKLDTLFPERRTRSGREILKVNNICSGRRVRGVSFSVREGEVLGIAGLVGSGRTETVRAVFSADRREKGEIFLDGRKQNIRSPRDAVLNGIGMVPEDRKTQGVLLSMTIRKNLTITDLNGVSRGPGFIRERKEREKSMNLLRALEIGAKNEEVKVEQLSGGNQQKVALAKWLGITCKVIIMDEPTRGIDVGAKAEIYDLINDLSQQGIGIVMISSEMMELIGMCDRILVMHEGRITGEVDRANFSEEKIMRLSIAGNNDYASKNNEL